MGYIFYLDDYGPITADISDADGNPLAPIGGSAIIVNQHTGEVVEPSGSVTTGSGTITYLIPNASPITAVSGRYIAYLTAEIDSTTKSTVAIPFDVLDKNSYLAVDRWRRKVEFSAPDTAPDGSDPLSDEEGRDWIDQAVGLINRYYASGYTSTLASIIPSPTANDIEFIATVASLMARTAWWAGKGEWRDDEMAFTATPFTIEWNRIFAILQQQASGDWYTDDYMVDNFNRDRVVYGGVKLDSPDYWYQFPDDPPTNTDIPV